MKLEPPDSLHVDAAQGWLGLGNHREANAELERISRTLRTHPQVLAVTWVVYSKIPKWEACVEIGEALTVALPHDPLGWIQRSYALHELKRTEKAFELLLPVLEKFPEHWTIPYNLACYTAQLGRLDECRKWFAKALAIDKESVLKDAADDLDLKPLRDSTGGKLWGKAG